MKIPTSLIPKTYEIAKQVFEGKLTFQAGRDQIVGNNEMNTNSAADYINNFRHLVQGQRFTRTNNAYSMEYFFQRIQQDYGSQGLVLALQALKLHIDYYEPVGKVRMNTMRAIYEKYAAISLESPDEREQDVIVQDLKKSKTKQQVAAELKALQPSDAETVIINGRAFKRDNKTIAQIKFLRDFKCQLCATSIKKKDGSLYVEAAHIKPKHQQGNEMPENILLLCPNHHKEFDLGDRVVGKHTKDEVQFTLNGTPHVVSLKIA